MLQDVLRSWQSLIGKGIQLAGAATCARTRIERDEIVGPWCYHPRPFVPRRDGGTQGFRSLVAERRSVMHTSIRQITITKGC